MTIARAADAAGPEVRAEAVAAVKVGDAGGMIAGTTVVTIDGMTAAESFPVGATVINVANSPIRRRA